MEEVKRIPYGVSNFVEVVEQNLPAKPTQEDKADAVSSFYDEVAIPALRIATQQHLEILSEIAELLSDSGLRERMKACTDAASLHAMISGWQSAQGG